MASSKEEILSLLTEHFQYTPLTLIDDIINTVNEVIYHTVDAVELGLNKTPSTRLGFPQARAAASDTTPDTSILSQSELDEAGDSVYPEKRAEIENGVHKLETLLEASVDRNFDKLEIYVLRNILSVRDGLEKWVQLEHYQNLAPSLQSSKQGQQSMEAALKLRRKLNATRRLNAALVAEQRRNAAMLSHLRTLLQPQPPPSLADFKSPGGTGADSAVSQSKLAFLTNSAAVDALQSHPANIPNTKGKVKSGHAVSPISTETRALISQLPQLRSLLAELRDAQAVGISAPPLGGPGGRQEDERRAYLEGAVRSAVGDISGLDGGTVGTAGMSARGAATGRGDVGAIEGIAAAMAGSSNPGGSAGDGDVEMNG